MILNKYGRAPEMSQKIQTFILSNTTLDPVFSNTNTYTYISALNIRET